MAFTGLATSYAGSLGINPGDYLNPDGTVSIGLMPTVDGITTSHFGSGNLTNSNGIIDMASGGSASLPQTSFACTANCQGGQTVTTPAPNSATIFQPSNAPEFDLLGDSANVTSLQDWVSTSTSLGTQGTITIPVGIFGVQSVDTMLSTVAGLTTGGTVCTSNNGLNPNTNCSNTASYAYVTLNLLSPTNVQATEVFALINGVTQSNILDGATTGTSGSTAGSYSVFDSVSGSSYNVTTQSKVFSSTISGGLQGGDTLLLDAQEFPIFSEYSNYELVSVAVTDTGAASTNHEILSALTVSETPEPATFIMLLAGLGVIAAMRLRRKTI
jgi:hypothetical protein